MTLEFRFEHLRCDRPVFATRWDLLLGIVAEFSIVIDERHLYYEEEFPVVEFAAQLHEWLRKLGEGQKQDFVYQSMESEESCLIKFSRAPDGWHLGSPLQRYHEPGAFDCHDVIERSREFIRLLASEIKTRLTIDIGPVLATGEKRAG